MFHGGNGTILDYAICGIDAPDSIFALILVTIPNNRHVLDHEKSRDRGIWIFVDADGNSGLIGRNQDI
jgi:hypothetical protein